MQKGANKSAYLHYKAYTCPACGHTDGMPDFKKTKATNEEFSKMSKIIQFQIKSVSNAIQRVLPSEVGIDKKYKFIMRIKDCDDESIYAMTSKFLKEESYAKGHGFLYLAAMIKNHEANREKLKQIERKRFGKVAPYVDLKKGI